MAGGILDVITSPVTIVTAASGERINGMTVAWIMQSAFNPVYVAVSIAPERFTHSLIKQSSLFGVNILSEGQEDIARTFGFTSGRNKNKFEGVKYAASKKSGLPVLEGVSAYLECRVVNVIASGDHDIFIGEVVDKKIDTSKRPLVFRASDYF